MVAISEMSRDGARSLRRVGGVKLAGVLAGVALTAAACGSKSSGGTTAPTSAAPAGGGATIAVSTAKVGSVGTVLVSSKGFTLYKFALDKPGKIACVSSTCVSTWPPLLVPSGDHVASMSGLSTEKRPNGDVQVTYKGSPVYMFSGDSKAGQANGVGIPDWSVASTTSSVTASTSPPTTGGGYGY
jgi:predicted lipoprotein with Yx(FWY)xxD motif